MGVQIILYIRWWGWIQMGKKGRNRTYEECFNTANRKISSVSCFSVMMVSIFKKCDRHQDIRQLIGHLGQLVKVCQRQTQAFYCFDYFSGALLYLLQWPTLPIITIIKSTVCGWNRKQQKNLYSSTATKGMVIQGHCLILSISIIINFIPKDYWGDMYNCVIGPKDNLFDNQDEYDYNDGYMMC